MRKLTRQDARLAQRLFYIFARDKYLGSKLGLLWAVFQPLALLLIYAFLFGFVFQVRIPGASTSLDYVAWLFAGLVPWFALQESILAGSNSIVAQGQLIKNLPLRIELVPIASGASAVFILIVGQMLTVALLLFGDISLTPWLLMLLPLDLLLLVMGAAIGLLLAPLVTVYKDFSHVLPTLLILLLFMSPVVYPVTLLPEPMQAISALNPIAVLVGSLRSAMYEGTAPNFIYLALLSLFVIGLFAVSLRAFRRVASSLPAYV